MSLKPTIDIDAMLIPIPGENPSGADVRYTRYDIIKEARREDEDLPQGDWKRKGPPKIADWGKVIEIATTVLSTESKDLQVAVWLLEALVKRHQFTGLRDGLKLVRELHARFWDTVYPLAEDGDLEFRAAPLEWLNEKNKSPFFSSTIKQIPVLRAHDGEVYSFFHWEESRVVDNLGRQSQQAKDDAIAEGKVTKEQLDKAEIATPLTHCAALLEGLNECCEEIQALDEVIKGKFGENTTERPSLENLKDAIENCREWLDETVQAKGGTGMNTPGSQDSTETAVPLSASGGDVGVPVQRSGGIEPIDRFDALRRLAAIAEFFRRTEPHSPVAYLVQRAARWGEMPLDEWLNEVIKSDDVLGSVRETLGIKDQTSD